MHTLRSGRKTILLGFLLLLGGSLLFNNFQTKAHDQVTYDIAKDPLFENALFIGDSFTSGLKDYAKPNAYFIEEVGMTLAKGLQRLPELDDVVPSRIFILLGINDLGHGYSSEEFVEQYRQMTNALKERYPRTTIYLQAIAPVTASRSFEDPTHSNEKINQFNEALKEFSKDDRMHFLNPWTAFQEDGALRSSESSDGLHLEYTGYTIWLEQLKLLIE
jgi:hypothetical protein